MFCLAQLTDTDGCEADSGPRREAEECEEDYQRREGSIGWEPEAEDEDDAEGDGEDHGVEAAETISEKAGEVAAEATSCVEDGEELVG